MLFSTLSRELETRAAQGLLRRRRTLDSPQSPHITVDGKPYLSFCSNDYLGLASHPRLIAALQQGRGSLSHFKIDAPRIIYMATLGKAVGVFGAFVAAEQMVIDTLVNHARSYVYTTATPPALSSAMLESLKLIAQGDVLRDHLRELIAQLRNGLADLPAPRSPAQVGWPWYRYSCARD